MATHVLIESVRRNSPEFMDNVDLIVYSDKDIYPNCVVKTLDIAKYNKTHYPDQVFSMMSMLLVAMDDLKDKYDRIIYMDCDCLVNKDIKELLDFDLQGNGLAACYDWNYPGFLKKKVYGNDKAYGESHYRRSFIKDPEKYINSGVLIIDCKKIKDGMWDRYLNSVGNYWLPDQDFLYEEYIDDTMSLPWTYNARGEGYIRNVISEKHIKMRKAAIENSKIIHYFGSPKPWHPWVHQIPTMSRQIPYMLWIDMLRNVDSIREQWVRDRVFIEVVASIPVSLRSRSTEFDGDVDDLRLKFLNDGEEDF